MAKIAVVGSGISGMTAAHLLSQQHEVHLYEKSSRLGGHTATVDVETASGRYAIDTGFIVFNDWTYPNFIRLMTKLGVRWKDSDMGFSVKSERTGIEYAGRNLDTLFAQRKNLLNPRYYRMLLDILRFNKESLSLLESEDRSQITLGTYLRENKYSSLFMDHYIVPMGAAIWSASHRQMDEFPAKFFIEFFKNHGMLSVDERPIWRVILGGSRTYIAPLTAPFAERIHLNSPVVGIRRSPERVELSIGGKTPSVEHFDHVVLASHSDETRSMLLDATATEKEILSVMNYQPNDVVLHTDESVLPKSRKAWAAWNYWLPKKEGDRVALSYHMNILQGFTSPESFIVSLNMTDRIDPKKILRQFTYDHPVFTMKTVAHQKRWAEISGIEQRTHYCGAYWGYGFHEDGVKSAVNVARTFGIELA